MEQELSNYERESIQTSPRGDNQFYEFLFNSNEIVEEVSNYLRGLVVINGRYFRVREPLMNEYGIGLVLSIVQPRTSRIFGFANLNEREIKDMAKEAINHITALLYIKHEKLGADKGNLRIIIDFIDHAFYATMSRAKDGQIMNLLQNTVRNEERNVYEKPKQKKGVLSIFGGGKD